MKNINTHPMTLQLSGELIRKKSLSPEDAGCQKIIIDYLKPLAFDCIDLSCNETQNLLMLQGQGSPRLLFAGHTDVVPSGDGWLYPPFEPTIQDNKLYGRGTADMKVAVAAMVIAMHRFVKKYPDHPGTLALALTSDEEASAKDGTVKIVNYLQKEKMHFDYCLIGEPSSQKKLGDTIKVGRRGSLHATLTIQGKQGHIAYPELALNPIHQALPALQQLCATKWDQGNDLFPPTQCQISNIHAGNLVLNVIPNEITIHFNFRFSPASTVEQLQKRTQEILDQAGFSYVIEWSLSAEPFYTNPSKLATIAKTAIKKQADLDTQFSTNGGTSDGRFLTAVCDELIELGLPNATAHHIDEHCLVSDIEQLENIYYDILEQVFNH